MQILIFDKKNRIKIKDPIEVSHYVKINYFKI